MLRRKYLSLATATGLSIGLSGCANALSDGARLVTGEPPEQFGTPIEHFGIEVTPTRWFTTKEIVIHPPDEAQESEEAPGSLEPEPYKLEPPTGATFLLTEIAARHVGETKRVLPRQISGHDTGKGNMWVTYSEERMSGLYNFSIAPPQGIDTKGVSLTNFEVKLEEKDATTAVYPGVEVSGWIGHEVPEQFDSEDTKLNIEWGAKSVHEESNLDSFEWFYNQKSRKVP